MRGTVRLSVCALLGGVLVAIAVRDAATRPMASVATDAGSAWASEARVIRADEIREAGVSRLGDLVFLLDDWASSTVDGFSWEMRARGNAGHPSASWILMVDGVRLDTDRFGFSSLNLVPVHISEIDSIEVTSRPGLHHGEFVDGGLIHIHTRRGARGYELGGKAAVGNESGDPGPYLYTEYASPNVDRIGPDYSAYAEYGVDDAYGRAAFSRYRHYPTDEAARGRNFRIAAGAYPQMNLVTTSGSFGGNFFGGFHRAFLAASHFDDYFFFKPCGREIPVVSRLSSGGLSGRMLFGDENGVEYRIAYEKREIDRRPNSLDLDFDWLEEEWAGSVEAFIDGSSLRQRYGVGFESVTAKTRYALSQSGYVLYNIYAGWTLSTFDKLSHNVAVKATGSEGDLSFEASLSQWWRVSAAHRVDLAASYVEEPPEHDGRIWYWNERGYRFLEDAGVDVTRDGRIGTARWWSIDAGWVSNFGGRLSGSVAAYYKSSSNLTLEEQRFQFDPDEQAFSAPVRLLSGEEGVVAGGELSAEARPFNGVRFRSLYRYEKVVTGGDAFRWSGDTVPRHLFRQTAAYAPAPSFTLWARLNYTSASEWHDYEDALEQSGGVYRSKVDSFVTVDAAAVKWFWEKRFKASVLFRDLLRQAPRYHPIGASFDTSVYVEVEFGLGSVER